MKKSTKLAGIILMSSALLLGACGNQNILGEQPSPQASATTSASSRTAVSGTAKSATKASSAEKTANPAGAAATETEASKEIKVSTESSEVVTSSTDLTTSTETSQVQATDEIGPIYSTSANSSVVLGDLLAGNYASIAGTWSNAQGESFTITADGQVTFESGKTYTVVNGKQSNGVFSATVASSTGNASFIVYPADTADLLGTTAAYDRIVIGQSEQMFATPFTRGGSLELAEATAKEETKEDSTASQTDFSALAGTWVNDQGQALPIAPNGKGGNGYIEGMDINAGKYTGTYWYGPEGYGAFIRYVPAGQSIASEDLDKFEVAYEAVTSYDRIFVGHGIDMYAHPYTR